MIQAMLCKSADGAVDVELTPEEVTCLFDGLEAAYELADGIDPDRQALIDGIINKLKPNE